MKEGTDSFSSALALPTAHPHSVVESAKDVGGIELQGVILRPHEDPPLDNLDLKATFAGGSQPLLEVPVQSHELGVRLDLLEEVGPAHRPHIDSDPGVSAW